MFLQKIVAWIKSFFSLFNQQKSDVLDQKTDKPVLSGSDHQAKVSYSHHLISDLKDDHKNLVEMYISLSFLIEQGDYQGVVEGLNNFKEAFNRHLMQENVKFYAYFDNNFDQQSYECLTIHSYRKDMNQIAHTVVKFLKKWISHEVLNQHSKEAFLEEYNAIAAALTQRIAEEERELYVLYKAI